MARDGAGGLGATPGAQRRAEALPSGLADRLQALRRLYVAERDDAARRRLAQERPRPQPSFAAAVAGRLHELRALCALADHLHRNRLTDRPTRRASSF